MQLNWIHFKFTASSHANPDCRLFPRAGGPTKCPTWNAQIHQLMLVSWFVWFLCQLADLDIFSRWPINVQTRTPCAISNVSLVFVCVLNPIFISASSPASPSSSVWVFSGFLGDRAGRWSIWSELVGRNGAEWEVQSQC